MKYLFFDTETTGLDPLKNSITQISGIVIIAGHECERFNFLTRPADGKIITESALSVQRRTREQVMEYPEARTVHGQLTAILGKYIDKFNRQDKFIPVGYNIGFDVNFLREWFADCGDLYLHSWLSHEQIDMLSVVRFFRAAGAMPPFLENCKLSTVCAALNIEIDAHDAAGDIAGTLLLFNRAVKAISNMRL